MNETNVPDRARWSILALLVGAVTINYLDRAIVGIAAGRFAPEFHLDPLALGLVFSAFSWTYFAAQVPAGLALDRFGPRIIYGLALAGWSFFTLLHAATRGFASLLGCRLGLGLAEAPCFPANSQVVARWFPRAERARAVAIYTAAEYVGLGFLSPVLFTVMDRLGWRALFVVTGGLGLAYALVWQRCYRDPPSFERPAPKPGFGGADLRWILGQKKIWALMAGQFAVYSTFVFFLTWFPTYLATARHLGWIRAGFIASLPYVAGFFGILVAGWWSDWMLSRGRSLGQARKLPVIVGLILASTIVGANYTNDNRLIVAILSLAFFAQAMSSSGWAVLAEIVPQDLMGLAGGLFNAAANFAGVISPVIIGWIVKTTGSFVDALTFVGVVAALGALAWIFGVGPVEPLARNYDPVRVKINIEDV